MGGRETVKPVVREILRRLPPAPEPPPDGVWHAAGIASGDWPAEDTVIRDSFRITRDLEIRVRENTRTGNMNIEMRGSV